MQPLAVVQVKAVVYCIQCNGVERQAREVVSYLDSTAGSLLGPLYD
jgi:hypothetical protein